MEYNKIEQQLNTKLNQRTIEPSAEAWLRIKERKRSKSRVSYLWIYAAASVIVAIAMFWTIENEPAEQIVIVQETEPAVETTVVQTAAPDVTPVVKYIVTQQPLQKPKEAAPAPAPVVEAPIAAAELVVHTEPEAAIDYSSAESLLAAAQQELATKKHQSSATSQTALLQEVEADVDRSFKEKMIDVFKNKFKTIKIALKDE